jgi:hypothetical protein
MDQNAIKKNQSRIISLEAAIGLVVALINLALGQADIHIMLIVWISALLCILLCTDILRRTKWALHPDYGRRRFTLARLAILIAFLSFGALLSLHKEAAVENATEQEVSRHTMHAPGPQPIAEIPAPARNKPRSARKLSVPSRPEPTTSKNQTAANPCPPNIAIRPGSSDITITNNDLPACSTFVDIYGVRVLVSGNTIVQ